MVTREDIKQKKVASMLVRAKTRDKLKELSTSMDDTFDIIINRLIDFYENNK